VRSSSIFRHCTFRSNFEPESSTSASTQLPFHSSCVDRGELPHAPPSPFFYLLESVLCSCPSTVCMNRIIDPSVNAIPDTATSARAYLYLPPRAKAPPPQSVRPQYLDLGLGRPGCFSGTPLLHFACAQTLGVSAGVSELLPTCKISACSLSIRMTHGCTFSAFRSRATGSDE
jgi:hypothetical protein